MDQQKAFKRVSILLAVAVITLALIGYRLWVENQERARADFGMYISSQHNILSVMRNALQVQNDRTKFVDSLSLVKGEFMSVNNIVDHISIPESLYNFHKRGLYITNMAFTNAISDKPLTGNVKEIEAYTKQLSILVRELNYSKVIDNKAPRKIYKNLDQIGRRLPRQ